jgi:hypothetical protein
MASCPSCRRPLAIARPQCLYCGAALDPALVPPPPADVPAARPDAPGSAPPASSPPEPERTLVVIGFAQAEVARAAEALHLAPFEVEQRRRRGGWHLHKALAPDAAADEAARLRAAGLAVHTVPDAEARVSAEPIAVTGGAHSEPGLLLHTNRGDQTLRPSDLLLVVAGAIQREYPPAEFQRKRVGLGALAPGLRLHLYTRVDPIALELDPDSFSFDARSPVPTSSLLELRSWIAMFCPPVPLDESFRFVPPALGPSPAIPDAPALAALRAARRPDAPALLDNLRQFRFYSGWRAAVERRGALG